MGLLDLLANLGPDSLAEKRKQAMQAKLDAAGNAASGLLAPTTGTFTEGLTRALPITGEAWSANDAGNAASEGNYGQAAAMGLLGLLPLGGMMSAGLRAGVSVPKRMGQSGAIAWHGSPHKFDKFSLDKIGTGEGAQAYGHGLYLAEKPSVAMDYKQKLTDQKINYPDGTSALDKDIGDFNAASAASILREADNNFADAIAKAKKTGGVYKDEIIDWLNAFQKQGASADVGHLYKTDIPDEAVARFLDWDKPLSQQHPDVRAHPVLAKLIAEDVAYKERYPHSPIGERLGANAIGNLMGDLGKNPAEVSKALLSQGIPGIRYLDGGSRSGGAGTSNFVAFDPELIRILERNGIPTGNQPWKAGEWNGLLGGAK